MTGPRAALVEVFHSIQGEGRFVGAPMGFVRVATCPIRCRYCDTPHSYTAGGTFRVAVHGAPRQEPNPVAAERAVELALEVAGRSPWRATSEPLQVSLTGGEPLVYPDFVGAFSERLGRRGRVHLETAALDAGALRAVLPVVAHVSADYKLPETLAEGDYRERHVECVAAVAESGRDVTLDVKIVLTADHDVGSFECALEDLAPFRAALLLFLQPVTPFGPVTGRVAPADLADRARRAAERGFRFRVVPQLHPALGVE